MPRPRGDGEAQRDQILSATVGMLRTHGAETLRLRDVADAAGVSVGMIQYYFDGRERLVVEAFQRYSDAVVARLQSVVETRADPMDKLTELCETAAAGAKVRERSTLWLDLVALSSRRESLRPVVRNVYEAWVGAFQAVIEEGEAQGTFLPGIPATAVAEQLVMLVDGLDVASAIRRRGATRQWREERLLSAAKSLLAPTS